MTNLNEMKVYNPAMDEMELITPAWVESIDRWMHLFATLIKLIRYIAQGNIVANMDIKTLANMSMIEFRRYYKENKTFIDEACYGNVIPESFM